MMLPGRLRGSSLLAILRHLHQARISGTLALHEDVGTRAGWVHRIFLREGRIHDVQWHEGSACHATPPFALREASLRQRTSVLETLFSLSDARLSFHAMATARPASAAGRA